MPARKVRVPVGGGGEPTPIHVVPEPVEAARVPSGRVKHDEKMTVYLSSDELFELEHARLALRKSLGSAVDRGRIVRAAVAMALEELEAKGEHSALAERLKQS